jgi:hypothetical protein
VITDISEALRRALAAAAAWSPDDVQRLLRDVSCEESSREPDWDEEAGEDWGRVVDSDGVVALISGRLPLVIVRASAAHDLRRVDPQVELVVVGALDSKELRADVGSLTKAFPELGPAITDVPSAFTPERFAAEDLWFLTV